MRDNRLLVSLIVYVVIYTLLIVISGIALYIIKTQAFYGTILSGTHIEVSLEGAIEIATPHFVSFGIILFIVMHLLPFVPVPKKNVASLSVALYVIALLDTVLYLVSTVTDMIPVWLKSLLVALFTLFLGVILLFFLKKSHRTLTSSSEK